MHSCGSPEGDHENLSKPVFGPTPLSPQSSILNDGGMFAVRHEPFLPGECNISTSVAVANGNVGW